MLKFLKFANLMKKKMGLQDHVGDFVLSVT